VVIEAISSRARRKPARVESRASKAVGVGVSAMLPLGPGLAASMHWLPANGLRPPIAFLVYGLLSTLLLLGAAGLSAWAAPREDRESAIRLKFWMRILAGAVGLVLAWQLALLLDPPQQAYPWLQDPTGFWAMVWVIVPGIWAGVGPGCIIYLAAIKSIPEELYEAADLDGAGPLHKAYHVTFQTLLPLVVINFIGAVIGTFHAMESVLVLTGGGPGNRTMTLGMDIFFNAFTHLKFGYATAEAWVMGSLLIGFTVYQLRSLKKMRFKRAGA
jgi:ABC-type sugar transport system permease subunit